MLFLIHANFAKQIIIQLKYIFNISTQFCNNIHLDFKNIFNIKYLFYHEQLEKNH